MFRRKMQEITTGHRYFETQGADERVLLVARRHWTVYAPALVVALFVYLASMGFFIGLGQIGIVADNEALKAVGVAFFSIFLLFATLFVYINWMVNYLNIQVVTDEHIVDIDQMGIFSRKISELTLDDIQDVSATKKGVLQSFLNYGDIVIQTAGERPNFNFEKVPKPHELARKIMDIRSKYGKEEVQEQTKSEDIENQNTSEISNSIDDETHPMT